MILSGDQDPDFADEFCAFLQRFVANVDAAELLLLLARNPDRPWNAGELQAALATPALSPSDIQRYLEGFHPAGIVTRDEERRYRYATSGPHDAHVATLARLYIERPVTLFRVIYALRDQKIKTFADAFRLRG